MTIITCARNRSQRSVRPRRMAVSRPRPLKFPLWSKDVDRVKKGRGAAVGIVVSAVNAVAVIATASAANARVAAKAAQQKAARRRGVHPKLVRPRRVYLKLVRPRAAMRAKAGAIKEPRGVQNNGKNRVAIVAAKVVAKVVAK